MGQQGRRTLKKKIKASPTAHQLIGGDPKEKKKIQKKSEYKRDIGFKYLSIGGRKGEKSESGRGGLGDRKKHRLWGLLLGKRKNQWEICDPQI